MRKYKVVNQERWQNVKTTAVLATAVGVMLAGVVFSLKKDEEFVCEETPHTVNHLENLWGIAEKKCHGNIRHATDKLVKAYGTNIQAGDVIWLPLNQNCDLDLLDGQVYESCE